MPSPHVLVVIIPSLFYVKRYERNNADPLEKMWPIEFSFSRSFKVIGTDTDLSATCDFLLLFHGNQGPISYRFQDKPRFRSKIEKFSPPVIYLPPLLRGSPWNWVMALGIRVTRRLLLCDLERSLMMISFRDTIDERDRQRDRQADRHRQTESTALTRSDAR